MLPNTAIPTTWLSWTVVVSTPLASAAWAGGTRSSDWVSSGLADRPSPIPVSSRKDHSAALPRVASAC